jgi:hypothetical protein
MGQADVNHRANKKLGFKEMFLAIPIRFCHGIPRIYSDRSRMTIHLASEVPVGEN